MEKKLREYFILFYVLIASTYHYRVGYMCRKKIA